MFDLDKEIAAWRRTLEHNRAFLADDVEELEVHLRDHVEALVAQGQTEEAAFQTALRRLGRYGDVEEEYRKVRWKKVRQQRRWQDELKYNMSMLQNYLKIACRNLCRHPGYAFINITGLAVGMACCLLMLLYVQEEVSYDQFHEHADRIDGGPDGPGHRTVDRELSSHQGCLGRSCPKPTV